MNWLAYNATPESAPAEQEDVWNVSNGRLRIEGLTHRYAESLAEALNRRELLRTLGVVEAA